MKRLVRFVTLAATVAAVVAAIRALSRQDDALPSPAGGPSSEPWPPLRPEPADTTPAAAPVADATPTPDVAPAPNTPAPASVRTSSNGNDRSNEPVVVPEPDGVPVADEPTPAPTPVAGASWAEPTAEGECPDGYPIKAKLKSKIFHAPGQLNYDRTTPDRCYVDAEAAEADGLRAAKR
jgi:hypothetical protein